MRAAGSPRVVALALAAVVGAAAGSGCSRQGNHASGAAVHTSGEGTSPASPTPTVALPDLSHVAPPVRDQIQGTYATLTVSTQRSGSSAADLANAYGEMGKVLLAAEFGQAAASSFFNAQALAPDDMRWPYYLGHVYKAQGETTKSTASFERALQLSPNDIATLVWLGEAYLTEDRIDSAQSVFSRARSLRPAEGAALAGLGRVALQKREYANAARHLEEALAQAQRGDDLHYSLALAYRGLGDVTRAQAQMAQRGKGQMVVPDPLMAEVRRLLHSTNTYESRGIAALEAGDPGTAATHFRRGLELDPDDASLHHRLGTTLVLSDDVKAGREEFETALRLAPDLARAHYSLGVLLASSGQVQQAIVRLSAAVRHDSSYAEARLLLGDLLRHTGRTQEALQQYGEVIRIDPRVAEAQLGHAMALVDLGEYGQALKRLVSATHTHPDHPNLTQALARLLAAAPDATVRNGAQAVAIMHRLVNREPSPGPDVSEAMAMAYAELGDYQHAVAWQRQAITAAERDVSMRRDMGENLKLFERGEPCRTPWAEYAMP